jgi:hypothetical protein
MVWLTRIDYYYYYYYHSDRMLAGLLQAQQAAFVLLQPIREPAQQRHDASPAAAITNADGQLTGQHQTTSMFLFDEAAATIAKRLMNQQAAESGSFTFAIIYCFAEPAASE